MMSGVLYYPMHGLCHLHPWCCNNHPSSPHWATPLCPSIHHVQVGRRSALFSSPCRVLPVCAGYFCPALSLLLTLFPLFLIAIPLPITYLVL